MIRLENIVKTYQMGEEEVRALQGVSLHIPPADMFAIIGPSGSGKTTLMNMIGCNNSWLAKNERSSIAWVMRVIS